MASYTSNWLTQRSQFARLLNVPLIEVADQNNPALVEKILHHKSKYLIKNYTPVTLKEPQWNNLTFIDTSCTFTQYIRSTLQPIQITTRGAFGALAGLAINGGSYFPLKAAVAQSQAVAQYTA
uniref:Uncharacterized protein n=1 Tax=Treubia lacunosa TaxID=93845 RepID=G4Y9R6_9MARC|nr:hypothetical protein TrlaMp17 [Treubia lacunosa]AEH99712.1 hypothetical protein TrlaMp17 [Treubia lacunosa]